MIIKNKKKVGYKKNCWYIRLGDNLKFNLQQECKHKVYMKMFVY